MKKCLLFLLFFTTKIAFSQLHESFSDGNFTVHPTWSGSNAGNDFIIVSEQLRSNSTITNSSFYLSTTSSLANDCFWEFWCNLKFNTSGPNTVDIYLVSDHADLKSDSLNGYFIRLGSANDEISLYKRSGNAATSEKIIDGVNGILNHSNNTLKVRVTRSGNMFTLERDVTGTGTSFFKEGETLDTSFRTSSHFGILVQQSTTSFIQKHFFDDFRIQPLVADTTPPKLASVNAIDSMTIEAAFDEDVDSMTAKNPANYMLNPSAGPATIKTTSRPNIYQLQVAESLQTGQYLLSVSGIKDLNGNIISIENTAAFNFVKPYTAKKNDVVINEIFADPNPQIDLPSVEFIELWNTTDQPLKLEGWTYSDTTSTYTFSADSIRANGYIILCAKADTAEFKKFGYVIGVAPWPSLNNSGDKLTLRNRQGTIISQVSYADTWYKNNVKKSGGWTLERIDPLSVCEGSAAWEASHDTTGGTPGKVNSAYQKNYDQLPFTADSLRRMADTTLIVYLNKPVGRSSVSADKFSLSPPAGIISVSAVSEDLKQVSLTFSKTFFPGGSYSLTIQQLTDCSGNPVTHPPLSFSTPALPPPPPVRTDTATVYITEIFADPSPEVGLPPAEFLEIYNPGKDTIDLEGWTLSDPSSKGTLKKASILPDEYLILCPVADTAQYKPFGRTLGLSPWPSLNNLSDQIVLKSFTNRTVDSVAYADTWYKNNVKKPGGWTLERIDPLSVCEGSAAWEASHDTTGGTPGKVNSAYQKNYDQLPFTAD
ncbi:MAG TPA: lamin tail domain-containing protein, partial [Sphingobacteriaceae bacterium]